MTYFIKKLSLLATLFSLTLPCTAQRITDYAAADAWADATLKKMTLQEKAQMIRGSNSFFFSAVKRLGIPYIYLSDATQGVNMRNNLKDPSMVKQLEKSTAFPAPIMLAATFDPELSYLYAEAVGQECRAGGIEFLLGPGLNIYRNSQCGRNFEYFGEDPYLVSRIVEQYVLGMQSTGTAACLKHFLANNSDFYRRRGNSIIDERALNEIYLPGFQAGVDAGVASLMTSYNRLNGEWTGQSKYVITDLLRGQMGFKGMVMTDWNSTYDLEKIIKSGQNVEMPGAWDMETTVDKLIQQGKITEADVDKMIKPMLSVCYRYDFYNRNKYDTSLLAKLPQHKDIAYRTAAEGTVLLKNNGILPLEGGKKNVVAGRFVQEIPRGLGAAAVIGYDNITMRDALTATFGKDVAFAQNPDAQSLKSADVVIISVGTLDQEGYDRPFALPKEQQDLVMRAVANNPNTIVIVNSGSGIEMTAWADKVAAVLYGWYPGQNGFMAIADILVGKVNPSGKLPITIERSFKDSPAYGDYPKRSELYDKYINEHIIALYDVPYDESVLVGYRWYETKGIKPLFAFGHGLSYTSFEISKPKASSPQIAKGEEIKIELTLTNTGKRKGIETLQLYVSEAAPTVLRPIKELKGVRKTELAASESKKVIFELDYNDLAYWCDKTHGWRVNPGEYKISIGTSSDAIAHQVIIAAR